MPQPPIRLALHGALVLGTATAMSAQSAAHVSAHGVVHSGASAIGDPVGVSVQLDIAAQERLDLRFSYGVSSGRRRAVGFCGVPPCMPVAEDLNIRLTTMSVALPMRFATRGVLDWRIVPRLDAHGIDDTALLGASLGLEARYRRTPGSRTELVASADASRTSELPATADRPTYAGSLTRVSVGARYRFYTRR